MIQKYSNFFDKYLQSVIADGNYRYLSAINKGLKDFPYALYGKEEKKITIWCSNDYLGMSKDSDVVKASKLALEQYGVSSGGSRNISGTTNSIMKLENLVAENHKKESGLVFTSGYVSNEATVSALAKIMPNLVVFSDQYNHASIISGISNSKLQKFIYKHLDMQDLELCLQKIPLERPKIIIFESIYSMNGSISPIEKICELAKKYNALTYIDEVHSVGLYGRGGAGVADMLDCSQYIDIIQATLAKSYGSMGGYIVSSKNVIDAVRLAARGFIFTTALPPVITQAAIKSINILKDSDEKREKHQKQVSFLKKSFQKGNIPFFKNKTHIIPIILGCPFLAKQFSNVLLNQYSIFVQHINFPTVPKSTERLRITPTPYHNDEMIINLTKALQEIIKRLNLDLEKLHNMNNNSFLANIANVS
ncbi:MAG: 5-aminolevulinate synthase [Rickettsia sp.]|nr:5-aminolevulinate synthase [Rickettsia sp.]